MDNESKVYSAFKSSKGNSKEITVLSMFLTSCSLIFFIVALCLSIQTLVENDFYISIKVLISSNNYFPFQMTKITSLILLIILLISSFTLLCFMLGRSCLIKDDNFYDSLFSKVTKFVFIPVLINAGLFLISPIVQDIYQANSESIIIPSLILKVISFLFSLIIYLKTKFKDGNKKGFFFKKFFITSLMYFDLYYIFYAIIQLVQIDYGDEPLRGLNIFLQVTFIIIGILFVFLNKDVAWGICCIITWAGVVAYKYKYCKNNNNKSNVECKRKDDIAMGITFMSIIGFEILLVGFMFNKKLMKF